MLRSEATPKELKLKMVGSTVFGRLPKISVEQTYNMIISDGFLVDYSGYAAILDLVHGGVGRGAYSSISGNFVIAVVSTGVFIIEPGISSQLVGNLLTSEGDVFIAENNAQQVAITDGSNIYVYDYSSDATVPRFKRGAVSGGDFELPAALIHPGYITFQNGRLLVAGLETNSWFLSDFNNALMWPDDAQHVGVFQTKNDTVQAPIRFPGRGNLLFLFGSVVTESWTDVGAALFPYQKDSSFNMDYGTINAASIAGNEDILVWIAINEQSGPVLMYTNGGSIQRITTDGIDYQLANLSNPQDCYGFLFRQDGHQIYQFVFPTDNLSYIYDFNTKAFFTVTDENLDHHIAKRVVFFQGSYYFVSSKDGKFYEFNTNQTDFVYSLPNDPILDVKSIPRIRICPPIRLSSQKSFITKNLQFTIEQGEPNTITEIPNYLPNSQSFLTTEDGNVLTTEDGRALVTNQGVSLIPFQIASQAVDLSISRDGGVTFGSSVRQNMNATGKRKSRFIYRQIGRANDLTPQFRFWGLSRFTCTDGIAEVYQ